LRAALGDRYDIERELGRGGMATVWIARDRRHDRLVAIKVLHPDLVGAIGIDRFLREVRLTAKLQHPGIVALLDSGVIPAGDEVALPWYAMPYIAGESLRQRLQREVHLPVDQALRIAREAASALHAAHSQGIVHRDIKPENILLADGRVYVVDFGIAKAMHDAGDDRLTSTGMTLGTAAYMSPEQAAAGVVDARSDQYSLASVLYEMLAGEPPFTGPTAQAMIARRLAEPARPIRPVRSSVPEDVESVVLRALERVPADRYADTAEFAAALDTGSVSGSIRRRGTGSRRRQALVGAAVVAIVALGAWRLVRRDTPATPPRDPALGALFQEGMRAYDRRTPAGAALAIDNFTAAVRIDSTYAPAWVGLAKVYVRAYERQFVFPGVVADSVLRLAVTAVERAMALDSSSAEAWGAQAMVSRQTDPTDVAPAIRAARHAISIDSNSSAAWHFLALSLAEQEKFDSAIVAWRESVRRGPRYTQGLAFLGLGHYWRGAYDSAAAWADSSVSIDANYLLGKTTVGYVAIERGDHARGAAALDAARRLSTDVEIANALAGRALAEARAGQLTVARATMREAERRAQQYMPSPLHTAVYFAQAAAALGDPAKAMSWLSRYRTPRDLHFQLHLRCDPPFAILTRDARFRALLLSPPRAGAC
jgi:tetratricopeptide (TPR) repeat protein/predicted Ser/Thr protein kinase